MFPNKDCQCVHLRIYELMVRYNVAIMSSMVEQGVASIGPLTITFCVCFHAWGIDVIIMRFSVKKVK